jgi:glutaredoxin
MKELVVFSMKSCPFCQIMKDKLNEENIPFIEMDIEKHEEEYQMFMELVEGNEFVPALMIIDEENPDQRVTPMAPDRDYKTIEEGIEKVKNLL